jgi:subtilisin family serine protease
MGKREREVREGIATHDTGEDLVFYMPGELIVDSGGDHLRAERLLDGAIERRREVHERLAVAHYDVRGDVPELVSRLRKEGIRSGPNHVLSGEPRYKGGPGTGIEPAEALDEPCGDAGAGVRIAVLDTGYTLKVHAWLDQQIDPDGDVTEEFDVLRHDQQLDDEAGHGTFIAGVINRLAPAALIKVRQVLLSDGWGDEMTIATAIADCLEADIVNLSLGAYTQGNLPPIGIETALRNIPRSSVVVAAAGNANTDVPFWPAALKQVVAVAAVDSAGQRAPYSNFGHWVDCAAPGHDITSTFPNVDLGDGRPFKGWAKWGGTSFAAPYLAGAVAAEMSAGGGTAADAIRRVLAAATRVDPQIGSVIG